VNQRLVQFDVRLRADDYVSSFWDQEHRNLYLLRPQTEWPLSVDPLVWPSVFYSEIFRAATNLPYGSIEVDPSTDDGQYWLNLDQMTGHYETHKRPETQGVFVAIHLFSEKALDSNFIPYSFDNCALSLGETNPRECPPEGEFLGYDVADASRMSGLANCGYTDIERKQLEQVWSSRLNSYGLLKTLEDAVEFRQVCDKRVAEHAPFWIFGISKLSWQLAGREVGILGVPHP
jgi:hypothetical protein